MPDPVMMENPLLKGSETKKSEEQGKDGKPKFANFMGMQIPANTMENPIANLLLQEKMRKLSENMSAINVISNYFKEKAAKDKKTKLFEYFNSMDKFAQELAIKTMAGGDERPTLEKVKKNMKSGFIFRSINWDKFSEISREASRRNMEDHLQKTKYDYSNIGSAVASTAVGAAGGVSTIVDLAGASGGATVASALAPVSSGLGTVGAAVQLANAYNNYSESLDATEKAQVIVGQGVSAVADGARTLATGVKTGQELAGQAISGGATMAAGVAGVIGGAAYLGSGLVGVYKANERENILNKMSEKAKEGNDTKLAEAAKLAASTQTIHKTASAGTALKGATMIVGGALILAMATNPVGWILMGVAGIIGGLVAVKRLWDKAKRKTEVVDRFLDVDKKYKELEETHKSSENKGTSMPDRKVFRKSLLHERGFNSESQCYQEIVADMADMIYKKGVLLNDPEYVTLIEALGLKINKLKQTPTKELIAKKMIT